jgi:hypothetical protein
MTAVIALEDVQRIARIPNHKSPPLLARDEARAHSRELGTASACARTDAAPHSRKDVSATRIPFIMTTLPPRLHVPSTRFRLLLASSSAAAPYGLCALTACLRPRHDWRRPGSAAIGFRCAPRLHHVSDPDTRPMRPRVAPVSHQYRGTGPSRRETGDPSQAGVQSLRGSPAHPRRHQVHAYASEAAMRR